MVQILKEDSYFCSSEICVHNIYHNICINDKYLNVRFLFTDVFQTGIWSKLNDINDQGLKDLANGLPGIALQSRGKGTVHNYTSAFIKWRNWAALYPEVSSFPADPMYIALYLTHLANNAKTHAPITMAFYALSWAHKTAGLQDPTEHSLPKMVRDSSVRELGKGKNKKLPLLPTDIMSLVVKFGKSTSSLFEFRSLCMCILGYAGFFRYDELSKIRRCDIEFYENYMRIFVEKSKTDVCKVGKWVYISKTYSLTCPVTVLKQYLNRAFIPDNSVKFVFRAMSYFRSVGCHRLRSGDNSLSYTTVREFMLSAFEQIGLDKTKFGTHSLRAGGATAAANNEVPDRLFKKHGRWLSEKAKDGYVVEDLKQILSVSANLGL